MLTEIYIEALLVDDAFIDVVTALQNKGAERKPRRSGADNWSSVLFVIALGEEAHPLCSSLSR